jgi:hypothetical protein
MTPADPNRHVTASEFYDTLRTVLKVFSQGMVDDDIDRAIEKAKGDADANQQLLDLLVEREMRRHQQK